MCALRGKRHGMLLAPPLQRAQPPRMDSWPTALLRWLRSHRDDARTRLLRLAAASSAAALLLGHMQRRLALAAAAAPKIQDVPLSLVLDNVEAGRVHSAVLAAGAATFRLKDNSILKATLPALDTQWLPLLRKHAVEFSAQGPSRRTRDLLPFGYLGACGYMLWRLTNDQGFNGGRELPAASAGADDDLMVPAVSFADVAGLPRVKAQVAEVVDCLRRPERYARLGAPAARPAAVGPPGAGKRAGKGGRRRVRRPLPVLLGLRVCRGLRRPRRQARAHALRRGGAARAVRRLHRRARRRWRRARGGAAAPRSEHTLNQLLAAMDGVTSTARPRDGRDQPAEALDAALVRGRFDRVLTLQLPERRGGGTCWRSTRAARRSRSARPRSAPSPRAPPAGRAPARQPRERGGDRRGARRPRRRHPRRLRRRARRVCARPRGARPDTAADLDQFAANFMRGLQQASATGGSIDDNE